MKEEALERILIVCLIGKIDSLLPSLLVGGRAGLGCFFGPVRMSSGLLQTSTVSKFQLRERERERERESRIEDSDGPRFTT